MKKLIYFFVLAFVFGVCIGFIYLDETKESDEIAGKKRGNENSYNVLENENNTANLVETVSDDEKISPQAVLVINKHYKECNHTTTNIVSIPVDMVNMTEEKLKKEYSDWNVIDFSPKQVSIYKEFDGVCNEHFLVRSNGDKLAVYYLDGDNKEKMYEVTDIDVGYLTDGDKEKFDNGITVYGVDDLNSLLENFE